MGAASHDYVRQPFPVSDRPDAEPGETFRYLCLDPNLGDGCSKWVVSVEEMDPGCLSDLFQMWQDEATEGETVEIGFVEMTEAAFAALPEM